MIKVGKEASLEKLFPDGGHEFRLVLRRGSPREFFLRQDATGSLLAERRSWLAAEPHRYAALRPECRPVLKEFAELAAAWGALERESAFPPFSAPGAPGTGAIQELGAALEPDVLFLLPAGAGGFQLCGGALCFPSNWSLEEKIGCTLESIHSVVPGLNPAIGSSIQHFLAKLKPGAAFFRDNWGIAATAELNLHPSRRIPAPALPVALDRLWLRVERQVLFALPASGGIVFGIRIELHRLDGLANQAAGVGLRRALAMMPSEVIRYKGLESVYPQIMGML